MLHLISCNHRKENSSKRTTRRAREQRRTTRSSGAKRRPKSNDRSPLTSAWRPLRSSIWTASAFVLEQNPSRATSSGTPSFTQTTSDQRCCDNRCCLTDPPRGSLAVPWREWRRSRRPGFGDSARELRLPLWYLRHDGLDQLRRCSRQREKERKRERVEGGNC